MNRFKITYHVLRGRPLMYKMHVIGGVNIDNENALITECVFIGPGRVTLRQTLSKCKCLLIEWWRLRKWNKKG